MQTFIITDEQEAKILAWLDTIRPIADSAPRAFAGLTAIRLPPFPSLTYVFSTGNGIGPAICVIEAHTGLELDITDYENW